MPFLEFLAPGLIMMAIIQNAFANTSASIMIGKIQGKIVDVLMPPLRPGELMFGAGRGRRHARPPGRGRGRARDDPVRRRSAASIRS